MGGTRAAAALTAANKAGAKGVTGWTQVQGTFNQKVSEAKETLDTTAISIGTALLPAVTKLMDAVIEGKANRPAELMEKAEEIAPAPASQPAPEAIAAAPEQTSPQGAAPAPGTEPQPAPGV